MAACHLLPLAYVDRLHRQEALSVNGAGIMLFAVLQQHCWKAPRGEQDIILAGAL